MNTVVARLAIVRSRQVGRFWFLVLADSFARMLELWRQRMRGRAALAQFAEHELRDIGVTAAEAQWECAKPFWRR
ncbi:MAG TPA: DUF1127 domain-containing protein [Stellaceae bacterium]|nr:DUF1127 domain-containing protein [Stellaceae bacterium]